MLTKVLHKAWQKQTALGKADNEEANINNYKRIKYLFDKILIYSLKSIDLVQETIIIELSFRNSYCRTSIFIKTGNRYHCITIPCAKELFQLGIITIGVPPGLLITAQVINAIVAELIGCGKTFKSDSDDSVH